jgi:hypothetical protein
MTPQEFIATLTDIVTNDRAETHGDMHKVHRDIATLWNIYMSMRRNAPQPLLPTDVAMMLALMKIARSQNGAENADDLLDAAGYILVAEVTKTD